MTTNLTDNPFPELTDEEITDIVNNLPTPTAESIAVYNAKMMFLHTLNKEANVFQDLIVEKTNLEESKVANRGKYMDTTFSTGKF